MKSESERILDLEIAVAHQQRFIDELNGVLLDTNRKLDAFAREFAQFRRTISRSSVDPANEESAESE